MNHDVEVHHCPLLCDTQFRISEIDKFKFLNRCVWGWRPSLENLMIRLRTQCRVRNAALLGGDNTMTQEIYLGISQISWGGGWGLNVTFTWPT